MNAQLKSLVFAAALSTLTGVAAHAQTVSGITVSGGVLTQSQSVSYADLDLSRDAGVKTLSTRIHAAAKTVCGMEPEYREPRGPFDACVKSAVDHAMIQVTARAAEATRLAANSQRQHGG